MHLWPEAEKVQSLSFNIARTLRHILQLFYRQNPPYPIPVCTRLDMYNHQAAGTPATCLISIMAKYFVLHNIDTH